MSAYFQNTELKNATLSELAAGEKGKEINQTTAPFCLFPSCVGSAVGWRDQTEAKVLHMEGEHARRDSEGQT